MDKLKKRPDGFLVRLPAKYRLLLQSARKKTRRPFTVEVQIALDAHLKQLASETHGGR